jgi:hypothetical protein
MEKEVILGVERICINEVVLARFLKGPCLVLVIE